MLQHAPVHLISLENLSVALELLVRLLELLHRFYNLRVPFLVLSLVHRGYYKAVSAVFWN